MKAISFIGRSLKDLKQFPDDARREAGYQLDRVQRGSDPSDWKAMQSIGAGVQEIRIKDNAGIYRVIYIAKYMEIVFVLHAFKKKTHKTAQKDIQIAKRRLNEVKQEK